MKKFFLIPLLSILSAATIFVSVALAGDYGLKDTAGFAGIPQKPLTEMVGNVIGTALSMVAVLFFGLMIYGGILWMTDRGNEEHSKKALGTITAAVIGILVVISAYAITNFVFQSSGAFPTTPQSEPGPINVRGCCVYREKDSGIDIARSVEDKDFCDDICTADPESAESCTFTPGVPEDECQ